MDLYRISHKNFIEDLSGFGAKKYGGRWNRKDIPVLYTSQARSLALLELIVHFTTDEALLLPYSYLKLSIPDGMVVELEPTQLMDNWHEAHNNVLSKITEKYFYKCNVMALKVPSAIVPHEYNVLLNPLHEQYSEVQKIDIEPIELDKRIKVF